MTEKKKPSKYFLRAIAAIDLAMAIILLPWIGYYGVVLIVLVQMVPFAGAVLIDRLTLWVLNRIAKKRDAYRQLAITNLRHRIEDSTKTKEIRYEYFEQAGNILERIALYSEKEKIYGRTQLSYPMSIERDAHDIELQAMIVWYDQLGKRWFKTFKEAETYYNARNR